MTDNSHVTWAEKANDNAVRTAHEILRTLVLVHGGAIIAVLSFVGGLVGSGKLAGSDAATLSDPLMYFGWGIVITIVAMIAAYFTDGLVVAHAFQMANTEAETSADGERSLTRLHIIKRLVHALAIVLTIISIAGFLGGVYALRGALVTALSSQSASLKPPSETKALPAS